MSDAKLSIERIQDALHPLREAMAYDGYELTLQQRHAGYILQVGATQDACQECLVPKEVFLVSVTQAFEDAGIACADLIMEVVYPSDKEKPDG